MQSKPTWQMRCLAKRVYLGLLVDEGNAFARLHTSVDASYCFACDWMLGYSLAAVLFANTSKGHVVAAIVGEVDVIGHVG